VAIDIGAAASVGITFTLLDLLQPASSIVSAQSGANSHTNVDFWHEDLSRGTVRQSERRNSVLE
jgi:hypothetical protein